MSSWTNVSKPGAQSYTGVAKPTLGFALRAGMATGLICPPTYAVTRTFGIIYTNISKPSAGSWTNISKPT